MEGLAARWISGDPKEAVEVLEGLAEKSIGRTLHVEDVVKHLPDSLHPQDLAKDLRLYTRLNVLRERFVNSYRHLLIGGKALGRRETEDLRAKLSANGGPRLVLLHGSGGDGKSGIAFELVDHLAKEGIPYLAVSAWIGTDQRIRRSSTVDRSTCPPPPPRASRQPPTVGRVC